MTPLAPLADDGLREEPIAQNDDNELLDLLNDLQGLIREMEYDEDEEEFGNEMSDNIEQSDTSNIFEELMDEARNPLYDAKKLVVYLKV